MNIEETKLALKAMGDDPDACLKSTEFLRSYAEMERLDSKYMEAVSTAGWPKCIELIEEYILTRFDKSIENLASLLAHPEGLERYAKLIGVFKRLGETNAETALRKLSDGDKAKVMGRIRLRLFAREKSALAQALETEADNSTRTLTGNTAGKPSVPPSVALPRVETRNYIFQKSGDGWLIGFENAAKPYPNVDGFQYLAEIIRGNGTLVDSAQLRSLTATPRQNPIQEQLRHQQLHADRVSIRLQLKDIGLGTAGGKEYTEAEIRESLRNIKKALTICSPENRGRLLDEKKRLEGIKRRGGNPTGQRDRTAVRHAIKGALEKIKKDDPKFFEFLNPRIKTGQKCLYIETDPTSSITNWIL